MSVTDGEKNEVAYYEYDAWGNVMTEAGTWRNPYCFATKERDYEGKSGLIYFGARYYSPEIGRWTQRDPAGTVDGLNLYAYVANNPASLTDGWGMWIPQGTEGRGSFIPPPPSTACNVYCFMAGVGGFYDITQASPKGSWYWCEIWHLGPKEGPNVGLMWGWERHGKTWQWKWRRRTYQSSNPKSTLLFGDFEGTTCDCADCDQIRDCLRKANADPGNFPDYEPTVYSPFVWPWNWCRGFNCADYTDALLESCCLRKGPIVERRDAPDVPRVVDYPY